MRIPEKIHAMERESHKESTMISSRSKTTSSRSTNSSQLSTSCAQSMKIRAETKAARLEVQIQFLDKEAELKKFKILKDWKWQRLEEMQ